MGQSATSRFMDACSNDNEQACRELLNAHSDELFNYFDDDVRFITEHECNTA